MNAQTMTTGASRMGHDTMSAMSNARAFLAKVQEDDVLAAKLADADGDMPAILALAAGASFACTARDLAAAYEELLRAGAEGPGLGAPSDTSHPMVYMTLGAPSDMSHPMVYMTLGAPSDFGYPVVYLPRGAA